ncbi:MAG: RHS repeat-associated core domain-containing protein, partial [Eubacteriales bacterium]
MCDKGANDLAQYTYGNANWGDLLTAYRGTTITYDSIGNPLSYYNGSGYTFTWTGRRLTSAVHGSNTITYTYNDEGIRTSKTVSGVEHIYHLDGSLIVAEEWDNKLCIYLYDADGSPIGMQYRSKTMAEGVFYTFWFEKNLQGDIVAVYNESGVKVYSYSYDAWGNVLITRNSATGTNGYAVYNPFYYRGYYRDSETGFYYLQSRYYDPQVGRFINADGQLNGGLLGYNLFAYCGNNPVMNVDPDGHAWWHWALAATVVAACAVATVITCGGFAAAVTAV